MKKNQLRNTRRDQTRIPGNLVSVSCRILGGEDQRYAVREPGKLFQLSCIKRWRDRDRGCRRRQFFTYNPEHECLSMRERHIRGRLFSVPRGEPRERLRDITRSTVYICFSISLVAPQGDGTSILRKASTCLANNRFNRTNSRTFTIVIHRRRQPPPPLAP